MCPTTTAFITKQRVKGGARNNSSVVTTHIRQIFLFSPYHFLFLSSPSLDAHLTLLRRGWGVPGGGCRRRRRPRRGATTSWGDGSSRKRRGQPENVNKLFKDELAQRDLKFQFVWNDDFVWVCENFKNRWGLGLKNSIIYLQDYWLGSTGN